MEIKYIGVFGKRNSGKSSLINFLLEEDVAIVSNIPGTTTDPVKKRLEIFGVGPVILVDTAGYDDMGDVGDMRVAKTKSMFDKIDLAIFLYTGNVLDKKDLDVIGELKKKNIPIILLHNQSDVVSLDVISAKNIFSKTGLEPIDFSCNTLDDKYAATLRSNLISIIVEKLQEKLNINKTILGGLVNENDTIALVCPIDNGAPTGRLILPQVMAIRDILDHKGIAVVLEPCNLEAYIKNNKPKLVVTDSQVFSNVAQILPKNIPLTSFSMLLARSKGPFINYIEGAKKIDSLGYGSKILILESCSHHKSCDDIGRVKLPAMFKKYLDTDDIEFTFVQSLDDIPNKNFNLAVQCGGCMVTSLQLNARIKKLIENGVPVTNYGMAIAYMQGIFERVIKPLI